MEVEPPRLFSVGIVEAASTDGLELAQPGLEGASRDSSGPAPQPSKSEILRQLRLHLGSESPEDDMTPLPVRLERAR